MIDSSRDVSVRWLAALIVTYLFGNVGAFFATSYLLSVHLGLAHLAPWVFMVTPIAGVLICHKGELLRKTYRFRDGAVSVLTLTLLTWLFVVYLYLTNLFPEVF